MTDEREVVERIKADLAETCPPGSKHTYALVAKADLTTLLSSLAEKEARMGELDPDWSRRGGEPCAYPECGCDFDAICHVAIDKSRALAAEARIRELKEGLRPFAEVGRLRASPYCRAVWSFETSFEPDTSGARVTDDDFRRAASLVGKEGGSSRDLSPTTGSGDDSRVRSDATDLFEALEAALVEGTPTLALQDGRIWIDGETAFDARSVLRWLRNLPAESAPAARERSEHLSPRQVAPQPRDEPNTDPSAAGGA